MKTTKLKKTVIFKFKRTIYADEWANTTTQTSDPTTSMITTSVTIISVNNR